MVKTDLTILLPIKDRPDFTKRYLSYMKSIDFPFKILIADGSKNDSLYNAISKEKDSLNLKYIRYPYDKSYSDFYSKLSNAAAKIDTPFAMLVDDDDFVILEGIYKSIDFLKRNPDYISCSGVIGNVFINSSDDNLYYGDKVRFNYEYNDTSISDTSSAGRVENYFLNYSQTWYDIHHTNHIKSILSQLQKLDFKHIRFAELFICFATIANGKTRKINNTYLMRQSNPFNSTNVLNKKIMGDALDQMLDINWAKDANVFFDSIAEIISVSDNISKNKSYEIIKKGFKTYLKPELIGVLKPKDENLLYKIKSLIKKYDKNHLIIKHLNKIFIKSHSSSNNSNFTLDNGVKKIKHFIKEGG